MNSYLLQGKDHVQLKVIDYSTEDPKAVVIYVHGMAEHQKRYKKLAAFLNEHQLTTITYDHRGHGESLIQGELGYLGKDGFNKMVSDLDTVVEAQLIKYPNKKVFLLGHSMGSFIVQRYIQKYQKVAGVILTGSSFKQLGMTTIKWVGYTLCLFGGAKRKGRWMNKIVFGSFNNPFKPSRTDFDWLNRSHKEVDLYIEDHNCGFVLNNQFYYDFIRGLIVLQKEKNIQKVEKDLPLLILAGGTDPVGKYGKKVKELYQAYATVSSNIELKLYKGARHEILLEENQEEVYTDILNWLEKYE